ncbi:MAG: hypothetical protein JXR03_10925 [Cyclobacteriaceae bacterium]
MRNYVQILVGTLLIAVAVCSRTIFHVPNFAALAGVGLFSGFYFRSQMAYVIPLLAVLISDFFIGFYDLGSMAFVYAAWMLPVLIGKWKLSMPALNKYISSFLVIGAKAVLASLSFYVVSNLGVWLFSGMYSLSLSGLIECYVMAVPFFRATILGDILFSGVLFGTYYLVETISLSRKSSLSYSVVEQKA